MLESYSLEIDQPIQAWKIDDDDYNDYNVGCPKHIELMQANFKEKLTWTT